MHLPVARHAVDAPFVEPYQRSGLAEDFMDRVRILEEFGRERVHIQPRRASRRATLRGG